MLACYVAASLWKESFITVDILERNVMCITFGQPLIGISFDFKSVATPLFEKFQSSIHAFFDREDLFPALLCHLCGRISNTEVAQHKEWQAPTSTQVHHCLYKTLLKIVPTIYIIIDVDDPANVIWYIIQYSVLLRCHVFHSI